MRACVRACVGACVCVCGWVGGLVSVVGRVDGRVRGRVMCVCVWGGGEPSMCVCVGGQTSHACVCAGVRVCGVGWGGGVGASHVGVDVYAALVPEDLEAEDVGLALEHALLVVEVPVHHVQLPRRRAVTASDEHPLAPASGSHAAAIFPRREQTRRSRLPRRRRCAGRAGERRLSETCATSASLQSLYSHCSLGNSALRGKERNACLH